MSEKIKPKINHKDRKFEDVIQKLEQAKTSGDKFQVRIWTDILKRLENKDQIKPF